MEKKNVKSSILVSTLDKKYFMFGNHGAVWDNKCHIAEAGFSPTTLCGVPMLSTNWARIENVKEIGCPDCIKLYNKLMSKEKK
jgi:hypothetical protein